METLGQEQANFFKTASTFSKEIFIRSFIELTFYKPVLDLSQETRAFGAVGVGLTLDPEGRKRLGGEFIRFEK